MTATPVPNRAPLAPQAFEPLPLGSVLPAGWLRNQLRIQADGLSGHIDEFWPDLGPNSGWLGGSGESWERGPYYLDGLVPLAYLLQDDRLIAKARRWLDWTLDGQQHDGWLGPVRSALPQHRRYDAWPVIVMLKALTQFHEATGDERVIPAMGRFFTFLARHLDAYPLHSWGQFRWADLLLSLTWLYNRTGDPSLVDLAWRLHEQGYDWTDHFSRFRFTGRTNATFALDTHVVNNAMGVKTPGAWFQFSYDPADRQAVYDALANLDRYHGQVTGIFSGDEHLAGPDPTQGTELCAVVEFMYSLETLLPVFGDASLADRLERVTYNALPAMFTPDMWAHQYDQQVNQVLCTVASRHWTNNHPDSNTFGLEPNFGCCTSNYHQGWPKLAASLWMATPGGGLAAVVYGPCTVSAAVGNGERVRIEERTDYPFTERVDFCIDADAPLAFPLTLRVPAWCEQASLALPDGDSLALEDAGYHTIERLWQPGDVVTLTLPMPVQAERRYRGAVSLSRGPLVYSLRIGEEWQQIGGEVPHADWAVHPTTPWNYALVLDDDAPEQHVRVAVGPVGERPFSPEGAPIEMTVRARLLPGWGMENDSAAAVPEHPEASGETETTVTLIPYGCTNLRLTEFPLLPLP
ncbi:MAG: beta-L-arabinofuranosidase domain-containing protein [Anaerolineae bacterium]